MNRITDGIWADQRMDERSRFFHGKHGANIFRVKMLHGFSTPAITTSPRKLIMSAMRSTRRGKSPTSRLRFSSTVPILSIDMLAVEYRTVRHQSFWVQRLFKLREYLAHLVGFIMRRTCGVASAESRVFCI